MANVPILNLPVAVSIDGTEYLPIVQGNVTRRVTTGLVSRTGLSSALPGSISWVIDGQGATLASGLSGTISVPYDATINDVTMEADQVGTVTVDIWKCSYSDYNPPTTPSVSDSITSATPPTITAAKKYRDTALTNWTTALTQGDILAFNIPSTSVSITRVTLNINLLRVVS